MEFIKIHNKDLAQQYLFDYLKDNSLIIYETDIEFYDNKYISIEEFDESTTTVTVSIYSGEPRYVIGEYWDLSSWTLKNGLYYLSEKSLLSYEFKKNQSRICAGLDSVIKENITFKINRQYNLNLNPPVLVGIIR